MRDDSDRIIGFRQYSTSGTLLETYYYEFNLQGDVVALYDSSKAIVAKYAYDSWGKILSVTNASGAAITAGGNVAIVNPIRYRGYYYDNETGLYYLNSRYYDPATRRFINADGYISTGQDLTGFNMYTYCGNNPVNRVDNTGTLWEEIGDFLSDRWEDAKTWVNDNIVQPAVEIIDNVFEDINNYDTDNESEQKVLDANYFSSYKGTPVVKLPIGDNAASYGIIVIGDDVNDTETIKHEYGHRVQWDNMGIIDFTYYVAIPSLTANILDRMGKLPYDYYGSPWEAQADLYGGVNRKYGNKPWPDGTYDSYWDLIKLFFE